MDNVCLPFFFFTVIIMITTIIYEISTDIVKIKTDHVCSQDNTFNRNIKFLPFFAAATTTIIVVQWKMSIY